MAEQLNHSSTLTGSNCGGSNSKPEVTFRYPRPGEFGWIVQQHGKVYSEEYNFEGFQEKDFERYVCEGICDLMKLDKSRNSAWIAAVDDKPVGCVILVEDSETVARLRFLLVAREGRKLGIATKLLHACINFAKEAEYSKLTQTFQETAIRMYNKAGFKCVHREKHTKFGPEFESLELALQL